MEQKRTIRDKLILIGIQVAVFLVLLVVGVSITFWPREASEPETTPPTTLAPTQPTVLQTEPVTEPTSPFPANPYGPNDFQFKSGYLTCLAGPSVLGIDVSSFQGEINWEQVRKVGVEFAIIRVGGRSYGPDGEIYDDDYALANYQGARAAGIKTGVYFFSQAITEEEAIEEANYVLERTKDWELEFPIVYDWEYISDTARTANVDQRTLTDCTLAFCRTIEEADREAMVYFNPTQMDKRFYLEELMDYRFWLAMYADRMTFPHRVDMWQYSCEGKVPGIEGLVDLNLFFPYDEQPDAVQ